jgi:ankyrin repeat protein
VTYAKKRLSVAGLQHALAVEPGQQELDQNLVPDIETIGSVCPGLVTFDAQSNVVRLVHYTAQEYLERTRRLPDAESRLLTTCLTYLSFDEFKSGPCRTVAGFMNRLQEYPLFSYAGQNWGHHARLAHNCSDVVLPFLERKAHLEASVQTMVKSVSKSHTFPEDITGLHVAACFGIEETVKALLGRIVNANAAHTINAKDGFGITPLYRAVLNLHLGTIKMILDTGSADADSEDAHRVTPLAWAAMHGHTDVACLLLNTGKVDVNSRSAEGVTPLGWAVKYGRSPLIKLLLDSGKADVNPKDRYGMTPLFDAVRSGDVEDVKLLLGSDKIQVDPKDSTGLTPLYWTAGSGHGDVFEMLLRKKADPSVVDDMGRTLLHEASEAGSVTIIKLLLGLATTQPMKTDKLGRTALFYAARFGRADAVMALLSDGRADPNFSDWYDLTPLFAAVANGHLEAVKVLLAKSQTLEKRLYLGRSLLL